MSRRGKRMMDAWISTGAEGVTKFFFAGITANLFYAGYEAFSWPAFIIGGLAFKGLFAYINPLIPELKVPSWDELPDPLYYEHMLNPEPLEMPTDTEMAPKSPGNKPE